MIKVFAHKYKTSHNRRRYKLRKWASKGMVKKLEVHKDGWLYGLISEDLIREYNNKNLKL